MVKKNEKRTNSLIYQRRNFRDLKELKGIELQGNRCESQRMQPKLQNNDAIFNKYDCIILNYSFFKLKIYHLSLELNLLMIQNTYKNKERVQKDDQIFKGIYSLLTILEK